MGNEELIDVKTLDNLLFIDVFMTSFTTLYLEANKIIISPPDTQDIKSYEMTLMLISLSGYNEYPVTLTIDVVTDTSPKFSTSIEGQKFSVEAGSEYLFKYPEIVSCSGLDDVAVGYAEKETEMLYSFITTDSTALTISPGLTETAREIYLVINLKDTFGLTSYGVYVKITNCGLMYNPISDITINRLASKIITISNSVDFYINPNEAIQATAIYFDQTANFVSFSDNGSGYDILLYPIVADHENKGVAQKFQIKYFTATCERIDTIYITVLPPLTNSKAYFDPALVDQIIQCNSQLKIYLNSINDADVSDIAFTLKAITLPGFALLEADAKYILFSPGDYDYGVHTVKIAINDGHEDAEYSFQVTVNNQLTFDSSLQDQTVRWGKVDFYSLPLISDIDGDLVSVDIVDVNTKLQPAFLTLNSNVYQITFNPTEYSQIGTYNLKVKLTDVYETNSYTFTVTIVGNNLPEFDQATVQNYPSLSIGAVSQLTIPTISDFDSDTITLTLVLGDGSNLLSFITKSTISGQYEILPTTSTIPKQYDLKWVASDGLNQTEAFFSITVLNQAPVLASGLESFVRASIDKPAIYQLPVMSDPDGHSISFNSWMGSGSNTNGFITYYLGNRTFTVKPTSSVAEGDYLVYFNLTDGYVNTTYSITFKVNHNSTFDPVLTYQQIVCCGTPYVYSLTTEDLDSDTVTISIAQAPSWITLSGFTLNATPDDSATPGDNLVTLSLNDSWQVTNYSQYIYVKFYPMFSSTTSNLPSIYQGDNYTYSVPAFSDPNPTDTVTLSLENNPTFVTLSSQNSLKIAPTTSDTPSTYTFDLVLTDSSSLKTHASISVIIKANNPPSFLWNIGIITIEAGQVFYQEIPSYQDADSADVLSIYVSGDFVSLLNSTHLIISPSIQELGSFTFDIILNDGKVNVTQQVSIMVTEPTSTFISQITSSLTNTAPYFQESIIETIFCELGKDVTIILPNVQDDEGDTYSVAMENSGSQAGIIKMQYPYLQVFGSLANEYQEYEIVIKISDSKGAFTKNNIQLIIGQEQIQQVSNATNTTNIDEAIIDQNSANENLQEENDDEDLKSLLTESTFNPFDLPHRIIKDPRKISQELIPYIQSINSAGQLIVKFNKEIFVPSFYEYFNQSIIYLEVINKPKNIQKRQLTEISQSENKIFLDWFIASFSPRQIIFQINFDRPELISLMVRINFVISLKENHYIMVRFVQNGYFIDPETHKSIKLNFQLIEKIPKQLRNDKLSQALGQNVKAFKNTVSAALQSNFIANILLSTTLQYLWGMINVLQLIVRVPLFEISVPINVIVFFGMLIDLTNFSFFSTQSLDNAFFDFTQTQPFSNNFNQLGYYSTNAIKNQALLFYSLILVVLLYLVLGLISLILRFNSKQLLRKIQKIMVKHMIFGLAIRFALESYIELLLTSLLNFKFCIWETSGDCFTSVYSIFQTLLLFYFPVWGFVFIKKNREKLSESVFKQKFGSLYSCIKLTNISLFDQRNSLIPLFYTSLFLLRRIIFAFSAVFLADYPLFQIYLLYAQSIAVFIFVLRVRPFETPLMNYLEIFNEFCIYFTSVPSMLFTGILDERKSDEDRNIIYNCGWLIVFSVFVNISVNVGVMISLNYKALKILIRKIKWRIKKYLKKMESLRNEKYSGNTQIDVKTRQHSLMSTQQFFMSTGKTEEVQKYTEEEAQQTIILPIHLQKVQNPNKLDKATYFMQEFRNQQQFQIEENAQEIDLNKVDDQNMIETEENDDHALQLNHRRRKKHQFNEHIGI